ncbi:MAG: hypothetical protein OSJ53_10835, partial [Kineothrix sp.]|nr:hypothetical protein [Kineothrix sp.]
ILIQDSSGRRNFLLYKKISAEGKALMKCFISYTYMVLKRTAGRMQLSHFFCLPLPRRFPSLIPLFFYPFISATS